MTVAHQRTLLGLAYVAGYVALASLSFVGRYREIGITPWDPPVGLTLGIAYLGGRLYAPFVLAAPVLAHWLVPPSHLPLSLQAVSGVLVNGIYLAVGLLLRARLPIDPKLGSVRDVLVLVLAAVGAAAAATVIEIGNVSAAGLNSPDELAVIAWRNFIGDIIGVLVVTPPMLLATAAPRPPRVRVEHALQLAALVAALAVIFGYKEASAFELFYLLFMPVLWVGLRHGVAGAAIALAVVQVGLGIGAEFRFGSGAYPPYPGFAPLQVLMVALAITGLLVGAVVSEREVTSERLRNQQTALQRALRLRSAGETAAAIAHEINQPLTAITSYAAVASEAAGRSDEALVKSALEKLLIQSQRAASVLRRMRDLLHWGGLEAEPISLRSTVEEMRGLLEGELGAGAIAFRNEVPLEFPALLADRVQLQQALHNLISNSIEAIRDAGSPGVIRVSAAIDGNGDAVVEVHDNGPGFPAGFSALAGTPLMTTKSNGSGLGLAVARSVAEAHGGSLEIAAPATGAIVVLRLPMGDEHHAGNGVAH